jgi:hypothetical protein
MHHPSVVAVLDSRQDLPELAASSTLCHPAIPCDVVCKFHNKYTNTPCEKIPEHNHVSGTNITILGSGKKSLSMARQHINVGHAEIKSTLATIHLTFLLVHFSKDIKDKSYIHYEV